MIDKHNKLIANQILATESGVNPMALFVLNEHNRLFVLFQNLAGGWMQPFELGIQLTSMVTTKNKEDYSELFAIDLKEQLRYIWQNPSDGDDQPTDWNNYKIELPIQKIECIPSYGTELTIIDQNQARVTNQTVEISASELTTVTIDGVPHVVGPNLSVTSQTDATGKITLYTRTNSLSLFSALFQFELNRHFFT
ncbi:MAG: hypothetical protein H8E40_05010, partial [Chloroflexi bacterium]|nr:hypothetical protein [Chloroflexota bacterium]